MSPLQLAGPIGLFLLAAGFLLFLLALGALAVAAARAFASKPASAEHGRRGCLPGCVSVLALGFLGLLGLAGFAGFLLLGVLLFTATLLGRVEVGWPAEGAGHGHVSRPDEERARVVLEVRGHIGSELAELVQRVAGGAVGLSIEHGADEHGPFAVYEFMLPFDRRDAREVERELSRELERAVPGGNVRLRHTRDL
jgi:hypothetical protein